MTLNRKNLTVRLRSAIFLVNRAAAGVCGSCSAFGLFFLVLSVTRRRPLLGQVLVGT